MLGDDEKERDRREASYELDAALRRTVLQARTALLTRSTMRKPCGEDGRRRGVKPRPIRCEMMMAVWWRLRRQLWLRLQRHQRLQRWRRPNWRQLLQQRQRLQLRLRRGTSGREAHTHGRGLTILTPFQKRSQLPVARAKGVSMSITLKIGSQRVGGVAPPGLWRAVGSGVVASMKCTVRGCMRTVFWDVAPVIKNSLAFDSAGHSFRGHNDAQNSDEHRPRRDAGRPRRGEASAKKGSGMCSRHTEKLQVLKLPRGSTTKGS